jgi:transcriptional regulator
MRKAGTSMTRADDERTLRILDMHRKGHSHAAIARALQTTQRTVQARIARVRTEDMLHDPEAELHWTNKETPE